MPFSLSDVIPNESFLRDLINDQNFLIFSGLGVSGSELPFSNVNILSVNEKLPVSKLRFFRKYIMQLFGYCYVHVSGQPQADLER